MSTARFRRAGQLATAGTCIRRRNYVRPLQVEYMPTAARSVARKRNRNEAVVDRILCPRYCQMERNFKHPSLSCRYMRMVNMYVQT